MAGNNIKGITVEIGGETGPLQNALKDVNKTSTDLASELKQVNYQLKFDPTNTTLLAQQQGLLADSITNTSAKLAALKTAEEQAQQQFANGEITAEQYRALQREVIKTENQLNKMEEQASTSNDTLKKVAESAAKMGDNIIVGGIAAVGTGLVAATVAGVTMGDELTKALNGIEAATGYSKGSMAGMEDIMLSIYSNNFGEDFTDIGKSIEEVAKQTSETGKKLETMTTNALLLRDTFEYEVGDSTKAATMLMNQFGIEGDAAFNLIAQGAQWGLDKNGDLLDTIGEYSVQFAQAGFSSEDMFNIFQNGAEGGALSSDKIGDSIKEFTIRAKDGSEGTGAAFKSLGLDAEKTSLAFAKGGETSKKAFEEVNKKLFEMKDPVAQNTTGVALYGTMWEDVGAKGIKALANTRGEISNTTDALKGINAIKYNSFGEGLEGIKRQLITGIAIPIGKDVLPKLNEFSAELKEKIPSIIEKIKPIIQTLIDKIVFLASNLNIILPVIAAVVASLVGFSVAAKVATFISTITGVIAVLTTGAAAATPVIGGLATAFTFITGPIGITIAIIAALVIGFTLLWTHCEGFRAFWIGLWEGIKNTTKIVVDTLVNFFTVTIPGAWSSLVGFFTGIPAWFGNLWTGVKTTTENIWNGIKDFFSAVWNGIVTGVMSILNPFILGINTVFNSMKDGFVTIFEGVKLYFTGVWNAIKLIFLGPILLILDLCTGNFGKLKTDTENIFNGLKDAFKQIWDGIKLIFTGAVTAISSFLKLEWNGIVNISKTIWNGLKDFLSGLWSGIKNTATTAWNGLNTTVTNICKSIVSGAKDIWNGLLAWFRELPGNLKTIGSNMFTSMKSGVTSTISGVTSAIKTGMNNAIKFMTGLPGEAFIWGKDMIDGIVRGIKSAAGAVGDAIKGVAQDIRKFLHFSVPDEGPLVDYESWMPDFMGGLAKGISNSKSLVTDAIKGLSTDMSIGMSLSPAMLGVGSLESANNQTTQSTTQTLNSNNTITVPVYLDGQVIAKVMAPFSDIIQGKSITMNGRAVGV